MTIKDIEYANCQRELEQPANKSWEPSLSGILVYISYPQNFQLVILLLLILFLPEFKSWVARTFHTLEEFELFKLLHSSYACRNDQICISSNSAASQGFLWTGFIQNNVIYLQIRLACFKHSSSFSFSSQFHLGS